MELVPKRRLHLLSGRSHLALADEIAGHLGVELSEPDLLEFASGEIRPRFEQSVRGADVFIVQSHCRTPGRSVNDSLMEQWLMIDAAKRASAKRITAVCPYYGYSRQDRKSQGREPISARMVSDFFAAAGADRIMSVDLHSGQIQGFFDGPVDHLTAVPSVYKRRPKDSVNQVQALDIMGDVDGRMCVLIDDMIDTASTICAAADILMENGATDVWAMATHAVLSEPAVDRLKNSQISRVVVTDTLPLPPEKQIDKIEVCSVARIIADAIDAVFEDASVSEIFGGENQT